MHVIDVIAMDMEVMDIVIGSEDVMHVIDVRVMVIEMRDTVIGLKL